MRQYSYFSEGWWAFLLVPLLLLWLFGLFQWRAVEAGIATNARQQLAKPELAWAGVETFNRGRDLLITGVAPDPAALAAAIQQAYQAEGVRRVDFAGEVATPVRAAEFGISWKGEQVILSGTLDSLQSMHAIVAQAADAFGAGRIVNLIEIDSSVQPSTLPAGLIAGLTGIGDGVRVSIVADELVIEGEVASAPDRDRIGAQATGLFPGKTLNRLAVIAPPMVEIGECQELLRQLLDDTKIHFEVDRATIKAGSHAVLTDVAATAKRCPDAQFEVAGHTDIVGDLALNMALSKRRAEAVIEYLANVGLNTERFSAQGYGPKQPIASNETASGRAQNRRIEFNIRKN